jgi:hypothetical protein
MRKDFNLTEKDYDNLFAGNVKYLVAHHDILGYGRRRSWLATIWGKLSNKQDSHSMYHNFFQYYSIYVWGRSSVETYVWTKNDLQCFIQENGLKHGDIVNINYIMPKDHGAKGYWCAGGFDYVVLKNGWEEVNVLIGA